MSLSAALNIAQSALLSNAKQTAIVSRNTAEARNPDYARRTAAVTTTAAGTNVVIQRATNDALFRQNLSALSSYAGQSTLLEGLERLNLSINGADSDGSVATMIGKLQTALQTYSDAPGNSTLAEAAVEAARNVVRSLNDGAVAIQGFRADMDSELSGAVGEVNALLSEFHQANATIVAGTAAGRDVSDALDQRDAILKKISEYVPVSTFTRSNNDMVVTTFDGTILFETSPRSVSFSPTAAYGAGMTGNALYVDGVPLQAGNGASSDAAGKLAGFLQLRDGVATTMQSQLDEIARGLIGAFSESADGQPALAGLFTWSGGPAVPPDGALADGLSASIGINAAVDSSRGGNAQLLRDGGINGAAYIVNTTQSSAFSDRLLAYGDNMEAPMTFSSTAGVGGTHSLSSFSSGAVGWFQSLRQTATTSADSKQALAVRGAEALSNSTGVNVDSEMSLLLELEHSYQASARIIQAVDEMLSNLLAAVR